MSMITVDIVITSAMMIFSRSIFYFSIAGICIVSKFANANYEDCDIGTYYPSSPSLYDREVLHNLLKDSHRSIIPYTSDAPDVWDALIDIDSDPFNPNNVHLIYKDISIPAENYGQTDTWNREHLWPKSLGVATTGPDFSDLHALRPSDWNVNAARSNRFFSQCGVVEIQSNCVSPAHSEAAVSTERDGTTFLPPSNVRGDIARAIFYMEMRYDGEVDEPNTANLTITDCPDGSENQMAYLSQLLEWHEQDPPSQDEITRNNKLCTNWQGNRNPFVDFPELVPYYYGLKRTVLGEGSGYDCSTPNPPGPPAPYFTPAPSPTTDVTVTGGTCKGLTGGDVMVTGFRSDNPDAVVLVALKDIPQDTILYMTDNAWTGTSFRTNEGTATLQVPSPGISAGAIFGFGDATLTYATSWVGSVALSASGDSIIVYCLDDGEEEPASVPVHLVALIYSDSGWAPPNPTDPLSFVTTASALPGGAAAITLSHRDNQKYTGPRSGTKEDLIDLVTNSNFWEGSDTNSVDVTIDQFDFTITSVETVPPTISPTPAPTSVPTTSSPTSGPTQTPTTALPTASPTTAYPTVSSTQSLDYGSCSGLDVGDIMVAGFNSDNPDQIALVALADVSPGAEIYLTDAAWTGTAFSGNEGTKKLVVPGGGIPKGTIFGFGGSDLIMSSYWQTVSGQLALSASSDNIFVYCIGPDGSSPLHLSAITYSTTEWNVDGSFSSSESLLPASLPPNCSVALPHIDNYVYAGPKTGNKQTILDNMSQTNHWVGSNSQRQNLSFELGSFQVTT